MTKLYTRISGVIGANAVSQLVQFGTIVFLARSNGPEDLGKVLVGLVTANFIFAFYDFGSSTFFTREIAKGLLSTEKFAGIYLYRVTIFSALNFVLALFGILSDNLFLASISAVAVSQYCFHGLQSVAKSDPKITSLSIALIFDRVVCLAFLLFMHVSGPMRPEAILLGWVLGQLVGTATIWVISIRKLGAIKRSSIKESMNYSPHFHLGLFAFANVIVSLDQAILGVISGTRQTGYLGAVAKWFAPLSMVSYSASVVVSNHSVRNFDSPKLAVQKNTLFWGALVGAAILVSIAGFFMGPLVELILGSEFSGAKEIVGVLAISSALIFINQPLASLLQYFNRDKLVAMIMWVAGPCYLAALIIGLPSFPGKGALFLVVSQLAMQSIILCCLVVGVFGKRSK
jgi:O-antigen/teichoic acid export membrane protein